MADLQQETRETGAEPAATDFDAARLEQTLKAVAAEAGVKAGVLVHPTRLATTGNASGPSLYHLLEVLGKERVLQRLDRALVAAQ